MEMLIQRRIRNPSWIPTAIPSMLTRVKGTSAGVKMPLPIRISRLTVAVQAKKSWMVPVYSSLLLELERK